MKRMFGKTCGLAAVAAITLVAAGAQAAVSTTEIITDPFTNTSSQHQTAVEPDTFAFGNTIVTAAQVGRFFNGGASGIGFATSTDGGTTWTQGVLPGITAHQTPPGSYDRVSDPSVAFDARHAVWLVSSIPLLSNVSVPEVLVSRSTDGGLSFGSAVTVATAGAGQEFDKNWTACDNTPTSPFYGNCYTTWDDFGNGNRLLTSTSTDGGLTWGTPRPTANNATGIGGQPVVRPNGTVIIPAANAFETAIIAFRSTDGGATWSNSVLVSSVSDHAVAGNLRTGPLPSAEIDANGKVYVVWQDCRFRKGCKSNDIVMSTSTDGLSWSAVTRIPIDSTTSNVDHFIPGIAVEPATGGTSAKLGLTYYFYRSARCGGRRTCQLEVGFTQSADGGATWSNHTDVAGPFDVSLVADTNQGRMVGDYISTSWLGSKAFGAFAVGQTSSTAAFDEAIFVPSGGVTAASSGFINTSKGEQPVPNAASDHASPRSAIRMR